MATSNRKRQREKVEDEFKDYESRPRRTFAGTEKDGKIGLPTKEADGKVVPGRFIANKKEEIKVPKPVVVQEKSVWRQLLELNEKDLSHPENYSFFMECVSSLRKEVMQDPQKAVVHLPNDLSKLEVLFEFCKVNHPELKVVSIMSAALVFADILPDYKINVDIDDKQIQHKKEVQDLRNFEKRLIVVYEKFIKHLFALLRAKGKHPKLKVACTNALCTLLVKRPGFNFRSLVLRQVIQCVAKPSSKLSDPAAACLNTLLLEDKTNEITLEIITLITTSVDYYLKVDRMNKLNPNIIEVTLQANLKVDLKNEHSIKKAKSLRKKSKSKSQKKNEAFLKLQETKAIGAFHDRYANQAEGLRELFLIYLKVLKNCEENHLQESKHLKLVLQGVCKFGALIHIDLVQELVRLLLSLLTGTEEAGTRLTIQGSLRAIYSVCLILQSSGQEVQIDETSFVLALFDILSQQNTAMIVAESIKHEDLIADIIDCVEMLYLKKMVQPKKRVLTLISLLCPLAMNLHQSNFVLSIVAVIRALINRYSKGCEDLTLSENEREEEFEYLDTSFNTSPLWSLCNLNFSYHPEISSYARKTVKLQPPNDKERPFAMYKNFDVSSGVFKPALKQPKSNSAITQAKAKHKNRLVLLKHDPAIDIEV